MSLNFKDIKKILIPTDGSEYSAHAAELGISIAKLTGAEIMIVYVVDEVALDQMAKLTNRETVEQALKEDGQRYINYIRSLAEQAGVKAASIMASGNPFEQIVQLAKGLKMDLIAMGTYGRRVAERILIGSVAEQVIEYAPCPVLVVK